MRIDTLILGFNRLLLATSAPTKLTKPTCSAAATPAHTSGAPRSSCRECCRVLQRVAVCCKKTLHLRYATFEWQSVLQCVAACCSVLQRVAVCCKKMLRLRYEIFVQRDLNLSNKTLKKRPICVKRDAVNPGVVTTPCQYTPLVRHVCPKRPIFVE